MTIEITFMTNVQSRLETAHYKGITLNITEWFYTVGNTAQGNINLRPDDN